MEMALEFERLEAFGVGGATLGSSYSGCQSHPLVAALRPFPLYRLYCWRDFESFLAGNFLGQREYLTAPLFQNTG